MSPVKYYHPVPRGLEIRIREKLEEIERRRHDKPHKKQAQMIDPKLLRQSAADVAANLARRGFKFDTEAYLALEDDIFIWSTVYQN